MWEQYLHSKKIRCQGNEDDDYHTITKNAEIDDQPGKRSRGWEKRAIRRPLVVFIVDCDDRIYIGIDSKVITVLGENHEYARERPVSKSGNIGEAREIRFHHGFFAVKGTPIPDLEELLAKQPKQLEEILKRAHNGEEPVKAESVQFTSRRKPGSDWDKYAKKFERGNLRNEGTAFTQEGSLIEMLPSLEKKTSQAIRTQFPRKIIPKTLAARVKAMSAD